MKAPIFMKFETPIPNILKNYQNIFRKDSCTHACKRGINVRAHVSSRQNARVHVYALCARVCAWIFTKKKLLVLYYLMSLDFKFHSDRSFRCRDICKIVLTFKNHQFSMYFPYSLNYLPQKSSKVDNY